MTTTDSNINDLQQKLIAHLGFIYPEHNIDEISQQCLAALGARLNQDKVPTEHLWSEEDVLLITYGNTLRRYAEKPLQTLQTFLKQHLKNIVSCVHILPFFPYSSDDGFAVIDYTEVNPELGDWGDINEIGQEFKLMADLVINHASSQSRWFKNFQYNKSPGNDYFFEASPEDDLSQVVRPRTNPLLRAVETPEGIKHVWCTFGHDQVDLDFSKPHVLLEFIKIIAFYMEQGAQWIRLDAVAFLWKQAGTSSLHLPQTHEVIKLIRLLMEHKNPHAVLITETNVPNRENLTYFGNCNEAHLIYNFSLPPLVLNALMSGNCKYLKSWMMSMPPAPMGCTYLNFTASHDGIGLRPAEGLLSDTELAALIETMQSFGAKISSRIGPNGQEKPYEINISLFDAMQGTHQGLDDWQIQRFICSQTIMLSLEGVPAFYLPSLLATPNDLDKVQATQHNRAINRPNLNINDVNSQLEDSDSSRYKVFNHLQQLILTRREQAAFHPNATQFTLHIKDEIFAFWRQSMYRDQSIFCIHNLSNTPQEISLADLNLINTDNWLDLISQQKLDNLYQTMTLSPYQCLWLTNKF